MEYKIRVSKVIEWLEKFKKEEGDLPVLALSFLDGEVLLEEFGGGTISKIDGKRALVIGEVDESFVDEMKESMAEEESKSKKSTKKNPKLH